MAVSYSTIYSDLGVALSTDGEDEAENEPARAVGSARAGTFVRCCVNAVLMLVLIDGSTRQRVQNKFAGVAVVIVEIEHAVQFSRDCIR
jgi:hypothetical protein